MSVLCQMTGRIGIIGAGPAGLYTARELLKRVPHASITIFEKESEPFGLLRWGVAPDRHEFKRLIHEFEESVLSQSRLKFVPNTEVTDLSKISQDFDLLVGAFGAAIPNRVFGADSSPLRNVLSGLEFAGYYNGKPDPLSSGAFHTASIIGFGNVALDCARILWKAVNKIELPEAFCDKFASLKKIRLIGRKANLWEQACTIKEMRDLLKLCDFRVSLLKPLYKLSPSTSSSRRLHRLHKLATEIVHDKGALLEIALDTKVNTLIPDKIGQVSELVTLCERRLPSDLVIYCAGQHPVSYNLPSGLPLVGWCLRNGRGTLADCYNDARGLADMVKKTLCV